MERKHDVRRIASALHLDLSLRGAIEVKAPVQGVLRRAWASAASSCSGHPGVFLLSSQKPMRRRKHGT